MVIKSPCIKICKLQNDICVGCFRTIDEIKNWKTYSAKKKLQVLNNIKKEVTMLSKMTPNDKLKLVAALKDMSTSMTRVDAERDLQKNIKNDISKELDLSKKVFSKLAKVYHKQNFADEVATHQEFESLYEEVTK